MMFAAGGTWEDVGAHGVTQAVVVVVGVCKHSAGVCIVRSLQGRHLWSDQPSHLAHTHTHTHAHTHTHPTPNTARACVYREACEGDTCVARTLLSPRTHTHTHTRTHTRTHRHIQRE